jgi:hypothetical protein
MTDLLLNNINAFRKIATDNLELARLQQSQAKNTKSVDEHVKYIMQGRQYAIVAIVFSAFTLEAYINNYAARKRSNAFFKGHLDGLDFVSKWVVITEFFTGKQFPKDKQCYQRLEDLKKLRNELVHSKSKALQLENQADVKKVGDDVYSMISNAEKSIETISMVVKCLSEIDPDEKNYLSGFSNDIS